MRSVLAIVKLLFHDKRLTLIVLVVWMTSTCIIFNQLGAFHSQFMTFGPSPKTEFMAMKIDSWCKWWALASFSFFNTAINEFIASALCPWFTNTIQDQKTKYLDHPKSTCMGISLIYDFYTHVMSIFGLYLMFSQIDFLFIRMIADLIVTTFTTMEWMKFKTFDKLKHDSEGGIIIMPARGNADTMKSSSSSRCRGCGGSSRKCGNVYDDDEGDDTMIVHSSSGGNNNSSIDKENTTAKSCEDVVVGILSPRAAAPCVDEKSACAAPLLGGPS